VAEIDMETPDELRDKATRYRSLKGNLTDQRVLQALTELADEYDTLAAKLDGKASQNGGDQSPVPIP
jgi:hypothetical protein